MRKLILVTLATALGTWAAYAQQPAMTPDSLKMMQQMQSMTPEQQQQFVGQMQQNAQQMQNCFNEAGGEAAVQKLQVKSEAINAKIHQLCSAGQRDAALAYAMEEGTAMRNDPAVQKMLQCSNGMQQKMGYLHTGEAGHKHICDEMGSQ